MSFDVRGTTNVTRAAEARFDEFAPEIRRVVYTTNAIESLISWNCWYVGSHGGVAWRDCRSALAGNVKRRQLKAR
jgi:hypothetical protein